VRYIRLSALSCSGLIQFRDGNYKSEEVNFWKVETNLDVHYLVNMNAYNQLCFNSSQLNIDELVVKIIKVRSWLCIEVRSKNIILWVVVLPITKFFLLCYYVWNTQECNGWAEVINFVLWKKNMTIRINKYIDKDKAISLEVCLCSAHQILLDFIKLMTKIIIDSYWSCEIHLGITIFSCMIHILQRCMWPSAVDNIQPIKFNWYPPASHIHSKKNLSVRLDKNYTKRKVKQ